MGYNNPSSTGIFVITLSLNVSPSALSQQKEIAQALRDLGFVKKQTPNCLGGKGKCWVISAEALAGLMDAERPKKIEKPVVTDPKLIDFLSDLFSKVVSEE